VSQAVVAFDLLARVTLLRAHFAVIAGKTALTEAELREAEVQAEGLLTALARIEGTNSAAIGSTCVPKSRRPRSSRRRRRHPPRSTERSSIHAVRHTARCTPGRRGALHVQPLRRDLEVLASVAKRQRIAGCLAHLEQLHLVALAARTHVDQSVCAAVLGCVGDEVREHLGEPVGVSGG
jgi:hypothetical protein